MFLFAANVSGIIYTFSFCIYFIVAFYVLMATKFENIFKQGKTWQIRIAYVFVAMIIAYFLASATQALFINPIFNN